MTLHWYCEEGLAEDILSAAAAAAAKSGGVDDNGDEAELLKLVYEILISVGNANEEESSFNNITLSSSSLWS